MESFEKERRAVFGQETGIGASFGMDLIIPRARYGHPVLQTTGDLGLRHLRHVFDVRTDSGENVIV